MSDVVWVALIGALPATISAIAAIWSVKQGKKNTAAIAEVHNAANERLDTALDKITELQRK